jgi:hypothetical protein
MRKIVTLLALLALAWPGLSLAQTRLQWTDLSAKIPGTVLDEKSHFPLLSFSASRGDEWLAGNPNQLFKVDARGNVTDLTPELSKLGFKSIRQVAVDGQQWLIVGDSELWMTQPDLAVIYDGMYFEDVSFILGQLSPGEWIGQIAGRRGYWIIPTEKSLYLWYSSMESVASIPLPAQFQGHLDTLKFHSVKDAWVAEYLAFDPGKTIKYGSAQFIRKFFLFDGQKFKDITRQFNGLGNDSAIASNGYSILAVGTVRDAKNEPVSKILTFDGKKVQDISLSCELQATGFGLQVVWTGKSWVIFDAQKNIAKYDNKNQVFRLPNLKDNFLNVGYGTQGAMLMVGYRNTGGIYPRLLFVTEK